MSSLRDTTGEIPSLDEQNGNMPGLAAFDAGYEQWIDQQGPEMPPSPQEEEMAYQEWLKQEELRKQVLAQRPQRKSGYHMVALKGKDKGYFEIRRDSDGEGVAVVRGRPEAKKELAKYNAA